MKLLKFGLHFWITIASVLSFMTGWIMLAHAPKPAQANSSPSSSAAPLPTLEPLAPLSEFDSGGDNFQNQPLFSIQPRARSGFNSFFTTGGS